MIITCYRYFSGYRNVPDKISLVPPSAHTMDTIGLEEIKAVLPSGYTMGETQSGANCMYDEEKRPCELCLSTRGNAVLAISDTRIMELKRAPDGKKTTPLQEARLTVGLTQKELSEASGVNIRQIQRVELGEANAGNLTARNLIALAEVLGVDPKDLI